MVDHPTENKIIGNPVGPVVQAGTVVLTTRPPSRLEAARTELATLVADQWRREAVRRGLDDVTGIPIHWTPSTPLGADWVAAFRAAPRKRWAVLGDAGTGKTSFAIQFLLAHLARRVDTDPVPVLLPIAGWNPETHPDVRSWVVDQLARTYAKSARLTPALLAELVADRHVFVIYDGVDELRPALRRRALAELARTHSSADPLLICCRTADFPDAGRALGPLVTIQPEPLTRADAITYLRGILGTPTDPWRHCLDDLRSGRARGLADLARTAFGLWLIGVAATDPATDPERLANTPDEVSTRSALLDLAIPALVRRGAPDRGRSAWHRFLRRRAAPPSTTRREYHPDQVTAWLSAVARRMNAGHAFAWWELAADVDRTRSSRRVALGFAVSLGLLGLAVGLGFTVLAGAGTTELVLGVPLSTTCGAVMGLVMARESRAGEFDRPRYLDTSKLDKVNKTVGTVLFTATIGVLYVITGSVALVASAAIGSGSVAVFSLYAWLDTPATQHGPATPIATWSADRGMSLFRLAVGVGGLAALAAYLATTVTPGSSWLGAVLYVLKVGVVWGSFIAPRGARAWFAYKLATTRLAMAGELPGALVAFLDDAHRMGLLRAVGPVYEFRHEFLRLHLARGRGPGEPPPGPRPVTAPGPTGP
ncbi:NACHT domain-containing protein [Actinokineospora auranticolor]|uniref:NACHT domain-containing protein n=1 Tax=Actinokineospora auranticolor TaxID=155976 RepID=A0A2S6GWP2_9PSEU|nr:NACHT domain-containing protein [Actinokineospora auranticolor]PPK69623.1 NACHT domain-containing protein [Actinokineospora auranticolor]